MKKRINFTRTIYDICKNDPDIIHIMKEIGFESMMDPWMMNTAGKEMTIPKGAAFKGICLNKIQEVFRQKGYEVRGI